MKQLTSADLKAAGIECEVVPPDRPIGLYPIGAVIHGITDSEPFDENEPSPEFYCPVICEFPDEEHAIEFFKDKFFVEESPLLICDTPVVRIGILLDAYDWRPGVFVKAWWRSGEKHDRRANTPLQRFLHAFAELSQLDARGELTTDDTNKLTARITEACNAMSEEERAEARRRRPIITEWAELCASSWRKCEAQKA